MFAVLRFFSIDAFNSWPGSGVPRRPDIMTVGDVAWEPATVETDGDSALRCQGDLARASKRARFVFLPAILSLLAFCLATRTTQPTTAPTPRVKPGDVHFEDIASRSGLSALNV
jgi:hypothetical protein